MSVVLKTFRTVKQIKPREVLFRQDPSPLNLPPTAFPGQDLDGLIRGLGDASIHGNQKQGWMIPGVKLNLFTLDNGLLFLDHGLDGTAVTEDGHPIHQTAAFHRHPSLGREEETVIEASPVDLDEVFVGFDGAWRNYFHWLCFGLVKSYLADRLLDKSVLIAVPDFQDALTSGSISYRQTTYNQSLEYSGLSDRVTRLPRGVYRARKLHFFWTDPVQPTDIIYLRQFYEPFDLMAQRALPVDQLFRNIYLTRARTVANRIDGAAALAVAETVERHGFTTLSFEGLDLLQQISIMASAESVVSTHGAGLTNCLFNRVGLRLLELNKPLDQRASLRPWFFLLSHGRSQRYVTLDTGQQDFAADQVESALRVLNLSSGSASSSISEALTHRGAHENLSFATGRIAG